MSAQQVTPEVLWAQRSSSTDPAKNFIFLTIAVSDISSSSCKIDLKPTSLTFTGHSETKKTTYHVELEFYGEIDVENSQTKRSERDVEFVLRKKELKDEYWPRLLKEAKKVHFLKTDFDKWVDEDEQNAVPDDNDYMSGMGGMGGMGGGMGSMPGMDGMGGIDFSKLGGGDMPDMGDMDKDMGGDDSDEEMPELEEEDGKKGDAEEEGAKASTSTTDHPKIEEVS